MKMKIWLFSFAFLFCVACSNNKTENNNGLTVIRIPDDPNSDQMDYSDAVEVVDAIRLETNKESVIGEIRKIEFRNNRFYVSDNNQKLFVFTKDGKFIGSLSRGRGPNEYFELRDFQVNDDGTVTILSYKTLVTFDSNLQFIGKRKFDITANSGRGLNPLHFHTVGDSIYLFMGSFGLNNIQPGVEKGMYLINDKNEVLQEYLPITSGLTGHQTFYNSGEKTYLTFSYGNDTIYSVTAEGMFPAVYVDFMDKKITEKDMMGDRAVLFAKVWDNNYKGFVRNSFENDKYLSFAFGNGRILNVAGYSKQTGEVKVFKVGKSLPMPKIEADGVCDGEFFSAVPSYIFSIANKDGIYDKLFSNYGLSDLKDDDNPVIFKFRFIF